jgi:DNA-binding transcriptional regulator YdaS (Cro superfamily)
MDAVDRLQHWITRSGISQRMAAQIFGVHYTFLNQILRRRRIPSLANAVIIERHTGITPGAWVPTDVDRTSGPIPVDRRKRKSA